MSLSYPYQMRSARLLLWQRCHDNGLFLFHGLPGWLLRNKTIGTQSSATGLIAQEAERRKSMNREDIEIREAIAAGEKALASLEEADRYLSSAGNWGVWDMIGGGLFSTMIKHSKINEATTSMEQAKRNLVSFSRELRDVNISENIGIEIGSFLTFADYFFDGLVADWLVQNKIRDAQIQVQEAAGQVKQILASLERMQYE